MGLRPPSCTMVVLISTSRPTGPQTTYLRVQMIWPSTDAHTCQLEVFRVEVGYDRRARAPVGKPGTDNQRLAARAPLPYGRQDTSDDVSVRAILCDSANNRVMIGTRRTDEAIVVDHDGVRR